MVTPAEHELITQLYERYVRTALLLQNLNGCSQRLDAGAKACKADINGKFDYILKQLTVRKAALVQDVTRLKTTKTQKLNDQLMQMKGYVMEIDAVE